jgi:lipopolysaccharide cholinephosphotransferase
MKSIIRTRKGEYRFKPIILFNGRKKINKKKARENILLLRNILIKTDIRWGLIFGTLLGAVREKNFITHDEDIDIYIFYEDKDKILELIYEFKKFGFDIARYEKNSLFSIIRNNEYIDFYFFKKKIFGRRCLDYFVPNLFFKRSAKIKFFNHYFPTLNNTRKYLEFQYGKDWKIPKINSHAKPNIFWKKLIKSAFPSLVRIYHYWKNN